ncbi:MAG: hypothetical protein NTV52_07915, partial [Acidobacteria bacterium]|nr:hypothetical protein [Acidobacteriota bacterium]
MRVVLCGLLLAMSAAGQQELLRPSKVPADGRLNAFDRTWEEWLKRTGEPWPDFASMRSVPGLPDALEGVKTRAEWGKRRVELKGLVEKWISGTMP